MKTFTKFLASLVLAIVMLPAVASAQLNVTQGGTGLTSVSANNVLYGVSSLRLGSEAAFTYNPSTNLLTASYASTTGFSATNGDLSKLTVTYASSTGFTATNATIGTATGTNLYGFGLPGSGCNGAGQAVTWASGLFGCGTITSAGDGVSNWFLKGTGYIAPTSTVGISISASSTIGGGTGASGLTVAGTATSTDLVVSNLTSALTLTGSTGLFAEYAGSSCTNQFVRSLDAVGAATCATVANTDLANSTVSYGGVSLSLGGTDATPAFNLADATGLPISTGVSGLGSNVATFLATPSSANFASAVTGETGTGGVVFDTLPLLAGFRSSASSTIGDGTGTGGLTVNGTATSTNLKVTALTASRLIATAADKLMTSVSNLASWIAGTSNEITVADDGDGTVTLSLPATIDLGDKTSLEIPNGTGPTISAAGQLAFDTTDMQLLVGTSTSANPGVIRTIDTIHKFKVPSTSPMFATSTTTYFPTEQDGYTVTNIFCSVEGGTSKIITVFGESITCDTDGQADDGAITINTIAAASTTVPFAAGNTSGVVNWLNVTVKGKWTRE